MPTLFRFLAFLALLGGLVFGGMIALVTFVKPVPRDMVEIVPPSRLQPK
ncbi:MAG: histidine kinase [Chelatococcus sp.]|nr:MAG: histidine kinase [Chelatococcus sp.]